RHVERGTGDKEHDQDAAEGGGQGQDHDERVSEILVVHHHQRKHEHGREQKADAEITEALVHALDLTSDLDEVAGLKLRLVLGDDLADGVGDTAKVRILNVGIDVVDGLDVGL